jgi:hypothetical protein
MFRRQAGGVERRVVGEKNEGTRTTLFKVEARGGRMVII